MPLQIRRGTNAERLSLTPTTGLVEGEIIYVTDEQRLYVGSGLPGQHQGIPVTDLTIDDAKDASAAALVNGTHQGISFTYNEIISTINATVDLSNYQGLIRADAIRGSLFADDSSLLINAETGEFTGTLIGDSQGYHTGDVKGSVFADNSSLLINGQTGEFTGTLIGDSQGYHTGNVKGSVFSTDLTLLIDGSLNSVNLAGTIKGDVYPDLTELYDLGSPSARFKDLYLSGSSINLGNAVITSVGSVVNLPAGSTVGGVEIGTGGFTLGSDYNINIIGDDSTVLVNSSTGNFTGDLKGSVYSETDTLLVDAVTGTLYGTFEGQATLNAVKIYSDVWFRDVGVSIYSASNTGDGGWVDCKVSANTTDVPQALSNSEFVGGFRIQGYTANDDFSTSVVYSSEITADADLNSSNPASNAVIGVANDDSFTLFKFKNDGTYVAPGAVQLAVYADDAARLAAIPTPAQGMMVFMQTGTTPAVTNKAVIFDGTNWTTL